MSSSENAPIGAQTGTSSATLRSAAYVAIAIVVIATFLPWQRHLIDDQSVSGLGSGGWIPMLAALLAAWALGMRGAERKGALIALACGAVATLASAYILFYFLTNKEGLVEEVRSATPLVGVYLALAGSIGLSVASLTLMRGRD